MEKDYQKRIRLMNQIKELVEKTFPDNTEQQAITYNTLHHNFQLDLEREN